MTKLFDVSVENIYTQIDDPIVGFLEKKFTRLKELMKFHNIGSSESLFNRKETKTLIDEIDKEISSRFGITFKHAATQQTIYATMPVSPAIDNILDKDKISKVDTIKEYLATCDAAPTCELNKDVEDIKNGDADFYSILNINMKSMSRLEKALNTKGLKIDFKGAKITGLTKDTTFFLLADFYGIFTYTSITIRELIAILMHEIGHSFTHVAYSYRNVIKTTVLLESFTNFINDGKPILDAIKLTSSRHLNHDIKNDNMVEATVDFTRELVKDMNLNNVLSFSDSEQLADQFSSRFGLSAELVTGLNKIESKFYVSPFATALMISLLTFIYILIMSMSIVVAASFSIMIAAATLVIEIVFPAIGNLFLGGDDSNETTYDTILDRIGRLKLDTVRQLRESKLPKKVIKEKLKSIDKIIDVMSIYINNKGISAALGDLTPWNIDKFTMTRIQRIMEELNENDLHVSKNKLALLL